MESIEEFNIGRKNYDVHIFVNNYLLEASEIKTNSRETGLRLKVKKEYLTGGLLRVKIISNGIPNGTIVWDELRPTEQS